MTPPRNDHAERLSRHEARLTLIEQYVRNTDQLHTELKNDRDKMRDQISNMGLAIELLKNTGITTAATLARMEILVTAHESAYQRTQGIAIVLRIMWISIGGIIASIIFKTLGWIHT